MRENRPYGSEGGEARAFPTLSVMFLQFPVQPGKYTAFAATGRAGDACAPVCAICIWRLRQLNQRADDGGAAPEVAQLVGGEFRQVFPRQGFLGSGG